MILKNEKFNLSYVQNAQADQVVSEKATFLCSALFGIFLCFSRFYGIASAITIGQFGLAADPSAYPGDMYAQFSFLKRTTYLFKALELFGPLTANTTFVFFLYVCTHLIHVYFIYKIAELLFSDLKKYNVGLLILFLYLYDHPVFSGAPGHQLVAIQSFRPTVANMPLIAASLYLFLRNRYLLSIFILAIFAIPLHFRSAWIFVVVVGLYMALYKRERSLKNFFIVALFLSVSGLVLFWYKSLCKGPALDFAQRLELFNVAKERYAGEGSPFLSSKLDFIRLFLVLSLAVYSIRFVKDAEHRSKLYFFYVICVICFVAGGIYTSFLYYWYPSLELFSLGFSHNISYPIILSNVLIGGMLLGMVHGNKGALRKLCTALLFVLAYFPNFKMKSIPVYSASIALSYFLVYRNMWVSRIMKLKPLTAWFFVAVMLFLSAKNVDRIREAYREKSICFPFYVFNTERRLDDCQIWAKRNTTKDSVFIPYRWNGENLYFSFAFRMYSGRTLLGGDVADIIYNYDMVQEHQRRMAFIDLLGSLIVSAKHKEIALLLDSTIWKIDYLVVPNKFHLEMTTVYQNDSYTVYFTGKLQKTV